MMAFSSAAKGHDAFCILADLSAFFNASVLDKFPLLKSNRNSENLMAGHRLWADGAVSIGKGFFLTGEETPHSWGTCCPNLSYSQCHPSCPAQCVALLGPKQRVQGGTVGLFLVAATLCSLSWLLMVPEPRGAPGLRPSRHCTTKTLNFLTGAYLHFGDDEFLPPPLCLPHGGL